MNTIILDLCHSIRTLRRSPPFTIAAVLSLAIGIGAAAAVFGIADKCVVLALCGGVIGLTLAWVALYWIRILWPQSVPRIGAVSIDAMALLFTFAISMLAAVLFGLAPARRASLTDMQNALQATSRSSSGVSAVWGRGNGLRHLLVVTELALCAMLLRAAAC